MGLRQAVVELLVPWRCPACGEVATSAWCGRCLAELGGLALPADRMDELADGVRAVGAYAYAGVVRDTMLAVKVRGQHAVVDAMRALLWRRVVVPEPGPGLAWTWVPTAARSRRQRGVCLPRRLAGPAAVGLLRRTRDSPDQTGLTGAQRRLGPRGVFRARGPVPPAVVLVDDVRTTGATARVAAAALRSAGAQRVLVVTFAVAQTTTGRAQAATGRAQAAQPVVREAATPRAGAGQPAAREASASSSSADTA